MTKNKRKQKVEEPSSSSEEEDENVYGIVYSEEENSSDQYEDSENEQEEKDNESQDEGSDFGEFDASFDIGIVNEKDYHSLKSMMTKLIPWKSDTKFNAGEISDLIIAQCNKLKFGRAIRIEHNEDPYGFASVLGYKQYGNKESIKGFVQYIQDKCKSPEKCAVDSKIYKKQTNPLQVFDLLLKESKTGGKGNLGLLFSERFLNIPHQLIHPLHQFLQYDIELLSEQSNEFKYDNYLILTSYGVTAKTNEDEQLDVEPIKNNKQQPKEQPTKKSKTEEPKNKDVFQFERNQIGQEDYFKPEDEYFKKYSSMWSTFDIPYDYSQNDETFKWTMGGNVHRKGLIMVVPQSRIESFLEDIKREFL